MKKYKTYILSIIPILAIIFNILLGFFERNSGLALVKALVLIVVLVFLLSSNFLRSVRKFWYIYVLILYWFILTFYSSNFNRSFEYVIKNSLSILFLPAAYYNIHNVKDFNDFTNKLKSVLLIFIVFAIVASVFRVGITQYGDTAVRVGLYDAQLYGPAVIVGILPYVVNKQLSGFQKYFTIALGVISFILLILSVRRTTVLISFIGISSFYFFQGRIIELFKTLVLVCLILLMAFPLYSNMLMDRLQTREEVFNDEYEVKEELRYAEFLLVLDDISQDFTLRRLLFGEEIFNSPGNYGVTTGWMATRQLHVDFTRFLHGSGIIGLLLYLIFLVKIFLMLYRRTRLLKRLKYLDDEFRMISTLSFTAFILIVLIHFSGQMEEFTFRSILFILLGSSLGLLNRYKNNTVLLYG